MARKIYCFHASFKNKSGVITCSEELIKNADFRLTVKFETEDSSVCITRLYNTPVYFKDMFFYIVKRFISDHALESPNFFNRLHDYCEERINRSRSGKPFIRVIHCSRKFKTNEEKRSFIAEFLYSF